MNQNLLHTFYLALAFLTLFVSAEVLHRKFHVKSEITRKYVHIATGLLTMLFPSLIHNHWLVLGLCSSFLIILLASMKYEMLPSINAVKRTTRGSVLYPIIVYGCFLAHIHYGQLLFYFLPILILALCDPMAAVIGKLKPLGTYTWFGYTKTLSGSVSFFVCAMILSLILLLNLTEITPIQGLIISVTISLVTASLEAMTHKGYDNLTIPAGGLAVLTIFNAIGFFG